jgi:hypothetical protein
MRKYLGFPIWELFFLFAVGLGLLISALLAMICTFWGN